MTNKELKRMNRKELLEMLIEQEKENERLREEVQNLNDKLASKNILLDQTGSIAEASIKINGVFEAAEAAVEQYKLNIKRLSEMQEIQYEGIIEEGKKRAEMIVQNAEEEMRLRREELEKEARERVRELISRFPKTRRGLLDRWRKRIENKNEKAGR